MKDAIEKHEDLLPSEIALHRETKQRKQSAWQSLKVISSALNTSIPSLKSISRRFWRRWRTHQACDRDAAYHWPDQTWQAIDIQNRRTEESAGDYRVYRVDPKRAMVTIIFIKGQILNHVVFHVLRNSRPTLARIIAQVWFRSKSIAFIDGQSL